MAVAQVKSGTELAILADQLKASSLSSKLSRRAPGDGEFADWIPATYPDPPTRPRRHVHVRRLWNSAQTVGFRGRLTVVP